MKARAAVWLVAIALGAAVAEADDPSSPLSTLTPGDRVRVDVLGSRETITATIESVTADELVLSPTGAGQPLRLSLGQLDRLEVERGRQTQWRKGALIGAIPGAVFGGIVGIALLCDPYATHCHIDPGLAIVTGSIGAVVGGVASGAVGALVGLAFKTERWVRVQERRTKVSLMLAPGRGETRFGVAVSF